MTNKNKEEKEKIAITEQENIQEQEVSNEENLEDANDVNEATTSDELTPQEKEELAKAERDAYITKLCAERALQQILDEDEDSALTRKEETQETVELALDNMTVGQEIKYRIAKAKSDWHDPTLRMVRSRKTLQILGAIFRTFILIGLCFVIILPILEKISYACRYPTDITRPEVVWIPAEWSVLNIQIAYKYLTLESNNVFLNTVFLSTVTMFIQIMATAVAGYAFARLKVKYFSNIFFYTVIITLIVPNEALNIARKILYVELPFFGIQLMNNMFAIFIMSAFGMGLRSAIFIYLFRQFFRGVPIELEESAEIDGAGVIRTFWSVMLPNARGAIITVGLFSFVWQYNDYYFATLFGFRDKKVLPVLTTALASSAESFNSLFETSFRSLSQELGKITEDRMFYGLILNTAALLMMLPLIIAYFFVQRQFVESIERTGITGM